MYKHSPSRGHRSKGIKVKHVLQIFLLVAVCFWLIYQVKHSQDKRREFDTKDETVVDKVQTETDIPRFGRKDLPRVTGITTDAEKHEEDDEDKETEEENKPQVESENKPEEDESKHSKEESEEDGRIEEKEEEIGGGDDEIDKNDLAKRETEHEHGEEVDEDKNREDGDEDVEENHFKDVENEDPVQEKHVEGDENEDVGKEGRSELEETQEVDTDDHNDPDLDGDSADTHEAREELYKADDASSEVAHNVQTFNSETANMSMGHADEMFGKVNYGQENETTTSVNADPLAKTEEQPLLHTDDVSNATAIEQKVKENSVTKPNDGSLQNSTSAALPNKPEINNNSTSLEEEHLSLTNGTQATSDADLSQHTTVGGITDKKDSNVQATSLEEDSKLKLSADENSLSEASTNSTKSENASVGAGESLSSNGTTGASSQKHDETDTAELAKDNSVGDEKADKSDNSEAAQSDETSSAHSDDENTGALQQDPIDDSDTSINEEDKESRVDLDTLPELKSEVQNTEEDMAE